MGAADVTSYAKSFSDLFKWSVLIYTLTPMLDTPRPFYIRKAPAQLSHGPILFETHWGKMECVLLFSISAVLLNLSLAFPATVRAAAFSIEHLHFIIYSLTHICSFHRCCPLIKASFCSTLLHPCDPQHCSFCMSHLSETDKRDLCGFLLMNCWSASVVLNKAKYNILWVPSSKDHWFGYWEYGLILSFFVQKSSLRCTTL